MEKIKLGEQEYDVKINLNTFLHFQQETGVSLFKEEAAKDLGPLEIRALIWASIGREIPIEEVGDLVTLENMEEIVDVIGSKIEESKTLKKTKQAKK